MPSRKIVFMGTPKFAVATLEALVVDGHEILCAYTRAPRPAGRGHREQRSPVHKFASANGITVRTPSSLGTAEEHAAFASLDADIAVVAAYGLLLPAPVLAAPRQGCVNVHASLLPRWRGAAPIQRAIAAGDSKTGITLMQMDEGLDTGPILHTATVAIGPDTTTPALHDRLAELGARLVTETLRSALPEARAQAEENATHAPRLARGEGRIDWSVDAAATERQIRAFNPWPGTWCEHEGARLRILRAQVVPGPGTPGTPGTVIDKPLRVACGKDALAIEEIQRAGRPAMATEEFLRGYALPPGTVLT